MPREIKFTAILIILFLSGLWFLWSTIHGTMKEDILSVCRDCDVSASMEGGFAEFSGKCNWSRKEALK
jgi:hypothetical protein